MANFPQSEGECPDISSPPFSLSDSATRTLSPSNNLTLTRSASARKSTQRRLCRRKRYDVNRPVHHRHQRTCFWWALAMHESAVHVCWWWFVLMRCHRDEMFLGQNVTRTKFAGRTNTRTKGGWTTLMSSDNKDNHQWDKSVPCSSAGSRGCRGWRWPAGTGSWYPPGLHTVVSHLLFALKWLSRKINLPKIARLDRPWLEHCMIYGY
jgi:hypothetical protein